MVKLVETTEGVILSVWAQPRAKKDRIVGVYNDCLKVAVTAPPEAGRANEALVEVLAEALGLPRSAVRVMGGQFSRQKQIFIRGLSRDKVEQMLGIIRK